MLWQVYPVHKPGRACILRRLMKENLDEVDIHLLKLLQADGRITNADLARKVNLSPPSVLQRVRKLEELGVIAGYTAVLDADSVGFGLMVIVNITLALHQEQPIERFVRSVTSLPEVLECLHISGEYDYQLKVVVSDMNSYERFIREKLSKIKGVGKIYSCFVMKCHKLNAGLPIE